MRIIIILINTVIFAIWLYCIHSLISNIILLRRNRKAHRKMNEAIELIKLQNKEGWLLCRHIKIRNIFQEINRI